MYVLNPLPTVPFISVLNACIIMPVVYSVLAPYLTVSANQLQFRFQLRLPFQPALKRISSLLDEASKAIMDSTHSEQYVVCHPLPFHPCVTTLMQNGPGV